MVNFQKIFFHNLFILLTFYLATTFFSCVSPKKKDGICGNGIREGNEECDLGIDNSDFMANTCRTDCTLPHCGDNVVDEGEQCDGIDLAGKNCNLLGYTGGFLDCNENCTWDVSLCYSCGNGIKEPQEECDSTDLNGFSCYDLGFESGVLSCSDNCHFNTSSCINGCGNGIIENGESCDLINVSSYNGCVNCHQGTGFFTHNYSISLDKIPMSVLGIPSVNSTSLIIATSDASLQTGELVLITKDSTNIISNEGAFIALKQCKNSIWASAITPDASPLYLELSLTGTIVHSYREKDFPLAMHCDSQGTLWILGAQTSAIYYMDTPGLTKVMDIGGLPSDFAIGDLNNDGSDDLVVLRSGSSIVSIYIRIPNSISTSFQYITARYTGSNPVGISLGDMDNNGTNDIIITYRTLTSMGVILNQGDDFSSLLSLDLSFPALKAIPTHFNGDGILDLALLYPSLGLGIYFGDGHWNFYAHNEINCNGIRDIDIIDVSGDGIKDLILTCSYDKVIKILEAEVE